MTTTENATPGIPADQEIITHEGVRDIRNLYTLYYLRGGAHQTYSKMFFHSGPFKACIERGKRHCELMNLRFISVKPFISDLTLDEKVQAERE
jgi:hypothetical protein